MIKKLLVIMLVLTLGAAAAYADTTDDVTISVTPITVASVLCVDATYNFQNLAVGVSSISATSLELENNGLVAITVEKHVESATSWTIGTSSSEDTFAMHCGTAAARPAVGTFDASAVCPVNDGGKNSLCGAEGSTAVSIPPTGADDSVELWFQIDMPTSYTAGKGVAQSIVVRVTA